ncbi:substrate-binding periplasmic protein [Roseibium sp.]|uniref:substrate-binding periplasmic protein n=1 Tax=Roseibium sp. TaxID=1936156 RepID=UPI00391DC473
MNIDISCSRLLRFVAVPVVFACLQLLPSQPLAQTKTQQIDNGYIDEIIATVVARTAKPGGVEFKPSSGFGLTRERLLAELLDGTRIEYAAVATKPDWEEQLIPIRIPLRKGLQGYRIYLIHRDNAKSFSEVETVEDLAGLSVGSGLHWSTNRVMDDAGFKSVRAETREQLFSMLQLKRFQGLPRGLDEVYFEHAAWSSRVPELEVEQTLAIYSPLPTYLFVTPKRPDLAKRFETGLMDLIADGTLDSIFWKHFEDDISRANLRRRRIFELPNANLGPQTPLEAAHLWFKPDQEPPVTDDIMTKADD